MKKRFLWWFKDDETDMLQFEIGKLLHEVTLLKDLLEDLQGTVMCKPVQYQCLVKNLEHRIEEIYDRAGFLIRLLKRGISNDREVP